MTPSHLLLPRDTTQYVLTGTETYRLSSRALMRNKHIGFKGWGGNLQNKSDEIRRIYRPDKGKVFVQVDQAGAEALIVSYLTRHGKFRDLFLNGIKSHNFVAMHLFCDYWCNNGCPFTREIKDLPIVELGKLKEFKQLCKIIKETDPVNHYYFIGKKTCHSANYKMQGNTFAIDVLKESEGTVRLSLREAERFLLMYHTLFPEIRMWHIETEQELSRTKNLGGQMLLRNLQGFPRVFTGIWGESLFREAIAFRPQSTVGTITNIAVASEQEYIEREGRDWDLLNNCHDSSLTQCPEGEEVECARVKKSFMEQELVSPRGEKFKMKSEAGVGKNWGKWNEKYNPEGIKELSV